MRRHQAAPQRYARILPAAAGLLWGGAAAAQQLTADGEERAVRPWAAPGLLRNPVAFSMDWAGNAYVAETDRAGEAVADTRNLAHLNAVEEDLRLRSVEDRRALMQRWIDQGAFPADYFTRTEDRVRLVRDTDGDGVADHSTVFAGGFNDPLDGIGAGTLWRGGEVFYTCIPHLWRLRDDDGDGVAEVRESVSYGYGIRWCFYGHDLHGLVNGPDGRIYFSMGDRGYNVESREGRRYEGTDRGGVFRCWPDGSGRELYATGLRNPQELAFDEFGNLFTGDNNCDSGDLARVVYVTEGGDSGWRQNVQSLPSRGPWNREHMWELLSDPRDPARPAWALPPIDHVGAGPSGLAYYPGTGESHRYDDTFLMVDFYGSGATLHAFRAAPAGAGFRLTERHEYYRGTTVTDIAWGPDSRLYLSDWGEGWGPSDKGNMFTITNETVRGDDSARAQIDGVAALLREGFSARDSRELLALLAHPDQRIRLAAQYELAAREGAPADALVGLAHDERAPILQRVHAIWCLGQVARRSHGAADPLLGLIADPLEQVRIQAVRTLGDLRAGAAADFLPALRDSSAAVRVGSAIALGKLGDPGAVRPLLDALDANDDADVFLRAAIVHALALIGDPDALIDEAAARARASRMGVVLALRTLENPSVAAYLNDADAGVAIEAARAVYDLRLSAGLPALARGIESEIDPALMIEPFLRRAIEANVSLGEAEHADRLARFAASASAPAEWRLLAMQRLAAWDEPIPREGVWGDWVDLPGRDTEDARRAVLAHLGAMRAAAAGAPELAALADSLGAKYDLGLDIQAWLSHLVDASRAESFRLVLLDLFSRRAPESLDAACCAVLDAPAESTTPALRMRARELLAALDPERAAPALRGAVERGTTAERQHAVRTLAATSGETSRAVLGELARKLAEGTLDREIALEVYEASGSLGGGRAAGGAAPPAAATAQRPAGFQTSLLVAGGDPERGRDLFLHHEVAQCLRCHAVAGEGGAAGPDLSTVGSRWGRAGLVQSVVEPNAVVAAGFGAVSAMPPMAQLLTPAQVRDIVAYLSTLQDPAMGPAPDDASEAEASGGARAADGAREGSR